MGIGEVKGKSFERKVRGEGGKGLEIEVTEMKKRKEGVKKRENGKESERKMKEGK